MMCLEDTQGWSFSNESKQMLDSHQKLIKLNFPNRKQHFSWLKASQYPAFYWLVFHDSEMSVPVPSKDFPFKSAELW